MKDHIVCNPICEKKSAEEIRRCKQMQRVQRRRSALNNQADSFMGKRTVIEAFS